MLVDDWSYFLWALLDFESCGISHFSGFRSMGPVSDLLVE